MAGFYAPTLEWSPSGKYIATGDQDSTVHFWIANTGQDLQMWGYETKVLELAWSFNSRYLATGGGTQVVVWDCSGKGPENTRPMMLEGHQQLIKHLRFQRQGMLLASGGNDGMLANLANQKEETGAAGGCGVQSADCRLGLVAG